MFVSLMPFVDPSVEPGTFLPDLAGVQIFAFFLRKNGLFALASIQRYPGTAQIKQRRSLKYTEKKNYKTRQQFPHLSRTFFTTDPWDTEKNRGKERSSLPRFTQQYP